jgi:hypothetical protein
MEIEQRKPNIKHRNSKHQKPNIKHRNYANFPLKTHSSRSEPVEIKLIGNSNFPSKNAI